MKMKRFFTFLFATMLAGQAWADSNNENSEWIVYTYWGDYYLFEDELVVYTTDCMSSWDDELNQPKPNPWDAELLTPSWKNIGNMGDKFKLTFDVMYEGDSVSPKLSLMSGKTYPFDPEFPQMDYFFNTQIVNDEDTPVIWDDVKTFNAEEWTTITYEYYIGQLGADSIRLGIEYGYSPGTWHFKNFVLEVADVVKDKYLAQNIIDGLLYKVINGSATVKGCVLPDDATTATIPTTVVIDGEEYPVTAIGENAFASCSNLTSIIIPNSITSIGRNAFYGCNNLQYNKFDNAYYLGNNNNPYLYLIKAESREITSCTINSGCKIIGRCAFEYCRDLQTITIPNGVVSIEDGAFRFCYGLSMVAIPESVTTIGESAFCYCHSLSTVSIPKNVSSIGGDAFYDVRSITYSGTAVGSPWGATYYNVVVDESGLIFADAEKTQLAAYIGTSDNVVIPNTVTTINDKVFQYCKNITSISIPNSVVNIGKDAFSGCDNLQYNEYDGVCYLGNSENPYVCLIKAKSEKITSCNINSGCKIIYDEAFLYCYDLASVTIPDGVVSIGIRSFSGCCMTSIIIPNSVKHIGEWAFENCGGLLSIDVPESVETIDEGAFYIIKNINYTGSATGSPWEALNVNATPDADGFIYADAEKTQLTAYVGANSNVIIPNTVTNIGDHAFKNRQCIKSVVIPNSVTSIGKDAFRNCNALQSVEISNSVTSIGTYAFSWCSNLTSVTIPNSVTSIKEGIFFYCVSLDTVVIPNSVTSIGHRAFSACSGLKSVTIGNSVENINGYAFYACDSLNSVTLSNSVKSIGDLAFGCCWSLFSVDVPKEVSSIGYHAFYYVRNLNYTGLATQNRPWGAYTINGTVDADGFVFSDAEKTQLTAYGGKGSDIVIPITTTSIGEYAFENCHTLTSVVIPNSVTSISERAFYGCYNLASVTIPNTVATIGEGVFLENPRLKTIDIPESVANIGDDAFSNVKNINYTGTAAGSPWGALNVNATPDADGFIYADAEKTQLTAYIGNGSDIVIPNTVTSIGHHAFTYCDSLTSVVISNSVTSIGESAFERCQNLKSVTIPNSVISIGMNAFNNCHNLTSVTIPNTVTTIGGSAFNSCYNLTYAIIPNSVTSMGFLAFGNCSIATLFCEPERRPSGWDTDWGSNTGAIIWGKKVFTDEDFMYMANGTSKSLTATIYKYIGSGTTVVIPEKVTFDGTEYTIDGIEKDAFRDCSGLVSVTIPNSILNIGSGAFYGCDNATFYCTVANQPEGWIDDWKPANTNVVWGYRENQGGSENQGETNEGGENQGETNEGGENQGGTNEGGENQGGTNEGGENQGGTNEGGENQGGTNEGGENQGGNNEGGNENNPPTSVADNAANAVNIYAYGNKIVVENSTDEIFVYNAMGALICRDAMNCVHTEITVNTTGVYIVKTGDTVKRVVVN